MLRQVAHIVTPEDLTSVAVQALIDDLSDTMRVGLAATQVFALSVSNSAFSGRKWVASGDRCKIEQPIY